jgi:hypothetical protein
MPALPFGPLAALPRDKVLRWGLVFLVAGQLLAFWMVCSHQVRKAEVRDATLQVQRVAVADCLRYIPHATLNSCASRVDPNGSLPDAAMAAVDGAPGSGGTARVTTGSATSVSFH